MSQVAPYLKLVVCGNSQATAASAEVAAAAVVVESGAEADIVVVAERRMPRHRADFECKRMPAGMDSVDRMKECRTTA